MLLGTHGDIVFGDDLVNEFISPFFNGEIVDFRQHIHIGHHHFVFEVRALSHEGMMLVAEDKDPCERCASEVG
jgi:hypothetical protein